MKGVFEVLLYVDALGGMDVAALDVVMFVVVDFVVRGYWVLVLVVGLWDLVDELYECDLWLLGFVGIDDLFCVSVWDIVG